MVREELLAAFLEGKTSTEETAEILHELSSNKELQEEFILSKKLDAMMDSEEMDILPIYAMAAESEGNLCDFKCEKYILDNRGISFKESELSDEAKNNRWLRDKGTPLHCVGRLLESHGLIVMRRYGGEFEDIKRAIHAGHDVIVVVNANKLHNTVNPEISYHAVVVVEADDEKVILFNPAVGTDLKSYSYADFVQAWKDAKSYMARVKNKDFNYTPCPIDLDDVELTSDLIDLREAIAENAHEVWADKRQEEGWVYGKERDDSKLEHPDMVPYSMLPESEKEYDRRMAFDTIKLMKKLGYDIVKNNESKAHSVLMRRLNYEEEVCFCECGTPIFMDYIYCPHCGKKIDLKKFM